MRNILGNIFYFYHIVESTLKLKAHTLQTNKTMRSINAARTFFFKKKVKWKHIIFGCAYKVKNVKRLLLISYHFVMVKSWSDVTFKINTLNNILNTCQSCLNRFLFFPRIKQNCAPTFTKMFFHLTIIIDTKGRIAVNLD